MSHEEHPDSVVGTWNLEDGRIYDDMEMNAHIVRTYAEWVFDKSGYYTNESWSLDDDKETERNKTEGYWKVSKNGEMMFSDSPTGKFSNSHLHMNTIFEKMEQEMKNSFS
eukprot:TRINITY_DN4754_c0_g1_i1.p1 TRINITY_DN4754_c0_g1~~TRINITY_DN4754_c0_g1_i1.p1  ORF type:complete len:125 (-),score=45.47 TRINITY_DN4754_c0_g1_i1:112-441(-)